MEKITVNMSTMDILMVMSEGNPGAITVLAKMLNEPMGLFQILFLDSMDIRGSKIWMLYKDCSGENMTKFSRTLTLLKNGAYSVEEIHANLDLPYALPFLSDEVREEDYITEEGEEFGPFSEKWFDYVEAQRAKMIPRLTELTSNRKKL